MDRQLLAQAQRQLEEERIRLETQFAERREKAALAVPEIERIQRQLAGSAARVMAAALADEDMEKKIQEIQQENQQLQQRRRELLVQNGFPADYLIPTYPCPQCKGYGYVGTKICDCLKKRYAHLLTGQLSSVLPIENENFQNFRLDYYSTQRGERIPVSPRQNMEYNLKICREYAENFSGQEGNLLLYGASGLGKTYLSTCIAKVVTEQGFSVCYDMAIHVIEQYERDKFSNSGSEEARQAIRRYEACDLLIVDDLGTELTTSYTTSALYSLINGRLMRRQPMIINTNMQPTDFEKRYSPAVASRLTGEFLQLRFWGDDIRQIRKRQTFRKES